jgi:Undecaprenyl-phosphate galactose phosphotransferase WbaP
MEKTPTRSETVFDFKPKHIKINPRGGYRLRMWAMMFVADITGILLAVYLGHLLNGEQYNFRFFSPGEAAQTLSSAFCILLFVFSRLYPSIGINPAEEIKLVVRFSFISFGVSTLTNFLLYSSYKSVMFITPLFILFFSIVIILSLRWGIRILATRAGIWGEPVVVLARGAHIDYLTGYFLKRSRLGFIPILAATDTAGKKTITSSVPVVDLRRMLTGYPSLLLKDVETVLVDASFFGHTIGNTSYSKLTRMFKHIIFVSDMDWLEGASLAVRDFEGLTGIEANKDQLSSTNSIIKRAMDIFGSLFGLIVFAPFALIVMLLIKLDSPGPVFYSQERISRDRRKKKRMDGSVRRIFIYKFRSMHLNADQALAEYLEANPQARLEWDQTQKLRVDPRITRVGRWIRKFSIDEVPQLYNVLRGEMSLVGPRPIMTDQVQPYGKNFDVYTGVRPGLTGLWQVSGRNSTTFKERARFDLYYVHNWSVWLDFYIIARTVWVILSRDGAY